MRSKWAIALSTLLVLGVGLSLFVVAGTLGDGPTASGATQEDLGIARMQMALSLAWHIILACLGVGFPALIFIVHVRSMRRKDSVGLALAMAWTRCLAVLFAVGAVSGTILSLELGMLWPGLMGTFGPVIGLPFAIEGIFFFIEAIFIGIYLYGRDYLSEKAHVLTLVPIVLSGAGSAFFVMAANAWMNTPAGFTMVDGVVTNPKPWEALFNEGTVIQATHMILAAYMVTGFLVASVHAYRLLRGQGDLRVHRAGLFASLALAAIVSPCQALLGHSIAGFVGETQPAKFAAMEGVMETQRGASWHIGGLVIDGEVRGSIEIPGGLSWLMTGDADAEIVGLDAFPADERPNAAVVHVAFQLMVALGGALILISSLWAFLRWRGRTTSRWLLWLIVMSGPASVLAMEAGWIVTEVGRQPWIVQGVMKVEDAVTDARGLKWGFLALVVVYAALTAGTLFSLVRLGRVKSLAPSHEEGNES